MAKPISTELRELPRRFWTESVARVALEQGNHQLVLEMVQELLSKKPGEATQRLVSLHGAARKGLEKQARHEKHSRVIQQLKQWLHNARKIKRERATGN